MAVTGLCRALALQLALAATASGLITVPQVFSDGMVLQTNRAYGGRPFMYGTAEPGEVVTITGLDRRSAQGVPYPALADESGAWRVQLDPYQGPAVFNATITGSVSTNVITIRDVVYGDVVLCSGQSNMNKPLSYVFNASAEIAAATYKNVRLFSVPGSGVPNCVGESRGACGPQTNWTAEQCATNPHTGQRHCAWLPLSPATVKDFSAVCYLTVTEMMRIQPKLAQSTMFGLVQAAVDGTTVEEWSTPASLALCPQGPTLIKDRTSQHFNGMIAPLVGFSVKMALWYQGEADAGPQARNTTPGNTRCAEGATEGCDFVDAYACRFSSMINTWRDLWGMGDFAFIFAQLAPVPGAKMTPQLGFGSNWPALRLQQAAALPASGSAVDTTGMAVITDLGDTLGPPHPKNKTEVGRRLALQALHVAYAYQSLGNASADGESATAAALPPGAPRAQLPYDGFADGPILLNATRSGNMELTLTFSNAEGLALKPAYECGVGGYNGTGGGCCQYERNWETSTMVSGDGDNVWSGVPADRIKLLPPQSPGATGQLVLTVQGAESVKRVRSNFQMYPQCVLTNSRQLVAAPLLVNVTASSGSIEQQRGRASPPPKGVSLTPPMGFNSWNFYHCNIDERAIEQIALALKSTGLAAKGYRYVNIDDCWQVAREPVTGVIVPDPARFPSGLKAIADWLHQHGMLFGIYTAAHGTTCQSRPGSYLYERIDSRSYCEFGIDYLKIDQCGGDSYEHHGEDKNMSWLAFQRGFKECLQSTGRAIVQSVESCGTVSGCGEWIANCANLWRTGSDLEATWGSVMKNLDQTAPLFSLAGVRDTGMGVAGHWNDPDMLQVGNVGLTVTESRSHFALWCFLAAPLLIGTDLHTASNETIAILGATELIKVDQDPLGFQGRLVKDSAPDLEEPAGNASRYQIYGKKSADGSVNALLLNRGDVTLDITLVFADVWVESGAELVLRDLWAEKDIGRFSGSYTAKAVPSHGNVALSMRKATGTSAASASV